MRTTNPARVTKCDKALTHPRQVCHTMNMNKETLSSDLLTLLDGFEADLADAGIDLDDEDEGPGWDLYGWDGPDED